MTVTIELSPEREKALKAQAQARHLTIEQLLIQLVDRFETGEIESSENPSDDPRPIWDLILDNIKDVPPEEFEKLPKDGASEHDHYLYGHAKRNP